MSDRGYEIGGRYKDDPIGSEGPRGKSRGQRKSGRDGPNWTPTEQREKNQLMRQFMRFGSGAGAGVSAAYREGYDAIDWRGWSARMNDAIREGFRLGEEAESKRRSIMGRDATFFVSTTDPRPAVLGGALPLHLKTLFPGIELQPPGGDEPELEKKFGVWISAPWRLFNAAECGRFVGALEALVPGVEIFLGEPGDWGMVTWTRYLEIVNS